VLPNMLKDVGCKAFASCNEIAVQAARLHQVNEQGAPHYNNIAGAIGCARSSQLLPATVSSDSSRFT
jgi:hypothetical protein